MNKITSLQNQHIKEVSKLNKRSVRDERRLTVIEGLREVSRALESRHKMPILGLEEVFIPKSNPKWHNTETDALKTWQKFWTATGRSLNVVADKQVSTGTQGRMIQSAHGSFDNDATTITTTLKRITGTKPTFEVEWIDY